MDTFSVLTFHVVGIDNVQYNSINEKRKQTAILNVFINCTKGLI